jgi:hypothetical protein
VLTRALAFSTLAAGLAVAVLGTALFLNLLSLRELAESTHLGPVIWFVFDVRDNVSHLRAQGLELLGGLFGVAMASLAAWWFRARDHGIRRDR